MLTCPKCGCTYREGYEKCSDCNVELIAELNNTQSKEAIKVIGETKWSLLMNVLEEYELVNIMSILENHDIISMTQTKGSGEYVRIRMGSSYHGFNLFVPEDKLEYAREVITAFNVRGDEKSIDEEMERELENYQEKKNKKIKLLFAMLYGPLFISIILMLLDKVFDIF